MLPRDAHQAEVERSKEVEEQLAEVFRCLNIILVVVVIMIMMIIMVITIMSTMGVIVKLHFRERVEMARKCLEKEEEVKFLKTMKIFYLKVGGRGNLNFLVSFWETFPI